MWLDPDSRETVATGSKWPRQKLSTDSVLALTLARWTVHRLDSLGSVSPQHKLAYSLTDVLAGLSLASIRWALDSLDINLSWHGPTHSLDCLDVL